MFVQTSVTGSYFRFEAADAPETAGAFTGETGCQESRSGLYRPELAALPPHDSTTVPVQVRDSGVTLRLGAPSSEIEDQVSVAGSYRCLAGGAPLQTISSLPVHTARELIEGSGESSSPPLSQAPSGSQPVTWDGCGTLQLPSATAATSDSSN